MNDLISRQVAIDATWFEPSYTDPLNVLTEVRDRLKALPSAQPDIIRCKDCKYWTHINRTNRYWCKTDDGLYDLNPSPNDFCSRAERRTDGSTD